MNQVLVLLYKDFLIRKRHYIITSFELLFPILISCVPLVLLLYFNDRPEQLALKTGFDEYYNNKSAITWPQLKSKIHELEDPYTVPVKYRNNMTLNLFYAPSNNVTDLIINQAIIFWTLNSPFIGDLVMRKFKNGIELEAAAFIFSSFPMRVVGTIFNNIIDKLPASLNYTIRCGDIDHVNTFQTEAVHKHRKYGQDVSPYTDTFFLAWQAAIEQAYISQRIQEVSDPFDFTVSLQRFPGEGKRFNSVLMTLLDVWPLLFSLGFFVFAAILTYRITSEKANGMLALMSSMGLSRLTYWMSCFLNYFAPGFIMTFIISCIYHQPPLEKMVVFRSINFFLLWLILVVFIINLIIFCFVLTIFFNDPRYAVVFLSMVYLVVYSVVFVFYFYGANYTAYMSLNYPSKVAISFFPMTSVFFSFQFIFYLETGGLKLDFVDIFKSGLIYEEDLDFVIKGNSIAFISLCILLWYADSVWPYQDKINLPFYFPFTKEYWFAILRKDQRLTTKVDLNIDVEFYEPVTDCTEEIFIQNLTKRFDEIWSSKTIIDNFSFQIPSGQITVLLGHHKTGKTTLLKILCGLTKATSGKVYIDGFDLNSSLSEIRKNLGVCLQKCILYEMLTVSEHFRIFAGLKGVNCWDINEASSSMQRTMLLSDCTNKLSRYLSNEQKRILSLGLAFIGKSKILILDEPTLNMSSKGGYHIWTLLNKMRADRIILLSSSSVKDICTFGDRIGFFSYGQLHFCGSAEFLKKKLDVGYKFHIKKDANFDTNVTLNLIKNDFSKAHLEKETEDLAIFNLESDSNVRFGDLFDKIETDSKQLGVKSFGITCITMEDVFMNEYIAYLKSKNADYSLEDIRNMPKIEYEILQKKSWNLHWSHFCALFYKRYHYLIRLWPLSAFSIILPFILMCVSLTVLQRYVYSSYYSLDMNIKQVYKNGNVAGFFETYDAFPDILHSESVIQTEFLSIMKENSISVYHHTNATTLVNLYSYTHYPAYLSGFIIGGSALLTETPHFVAWYNGEHYHTRSIALNLMHTAILRNLTGRGSIILQNHPLPYNYMISSDQDTAAPRNVLLPVISVISALVGASYAIIPTYEKTSRTKLFQLMSGLSMKMYWTCMFVWDALVHVGISVTLAIPVAIFESVYFIDSTGAVFFLFFVFGIAAIPICYLASLFAKYPVSVFIYICLFHAITGFIGTLIFAPNIMVSEVVMWIFRIFPCFCMAEGIYKMIFITLETSSFCYGVPENILSIICAENFTNMNSAMLRCCPSYCEDGSCDLIPNFITFNLEDGLLREILSMFVLGIIFLVMLALCETAMYQKYKGFIPKKQLIDAQFSSSSKGTGVLTEREHIENLLANGKYRKTLMLTVLDIAKFYGSISAVEDITFGVTAGECFGIVGGCRSGKSTLFKMLTGEIIPTAGNAFIKNTNLITHLKESYVGYCPQYDALLNHLTGRQMLRFYAKLRGVVCKDLQSALIKMMEIGDHADRLVKYYSFVDKRKLAVALAIIGAPPVLFLDEPSAGVDFVSKKIIWNLVYKAKNFKTAIVFSTKSILECQKLCELGFCTRLALMKDGNFHCLGSIKELETKYNSGKIVKIILQSELMTNYSIFEMKTFFENTVPKVTFIHYQEAYVIEANFDYNEVELSATIVRNVYMLYKLLVRPEDILPGIFTYHVEDSFLTLSALFYLMDYMKMRFNVHKYIISDSSLIEICFACTEGRRENKCF